MIAVLGAAGKVGFATSTVLRKAGIPVRAILRDAAKSDTLTSIGCEVAYADLQDPEALGRAISGADAIQVILPPDPQAQDAVGDMRLSIESLGKAIERARPNLVLAISDYGAHHSEGVGMPTMYHELEERLRRVDIRRVFLRSAEHMEGWGAFIPVAAASGTLPSLHQPVDKKFPTISAPDLGRIAADLLLQQDPKAGELVVNAEGPRRYCATEIAETLSHLLGRSVNAQPVPRMLWKENLTRAVSASTADLLVALYDAHNKGGLIDVEPNSGEVRYGTIDILEALRPLLPAPGQQSKPNHP